MMKSVDFMYRKIRNIKFKNNKAMYKGNIFYKRLKYEDNS